MSIKLSRSMSSNDFMSRLGSNDEVSRWYILNHIGGVGGQGIAHREIERFNCQSKSEIELFSPSYFQLEVREGKQRFRRVSLAYHYVFVKGTLNEIKSLCGRDNGFSFVLNRASEERYATVSDNEMAAFRIIARSYENSMPFFSLEDIDLEAGDIVEVVNGDFAGLKGTFVPRSKSNTGKIVLEIAMGSGTCAYNINVKDVRVIEFAKKTTRAHDQIEAFVPHLLTGLRQYSRGEQLDRSIASKVSVFASRMEIVELHSQKLDAKLQALLHGAYTLLGDPERAVRSKRLYEKYHHSVTNPWTQALCELVIAESSHDNTRLKSISDIISLLSPTSKSQRLIEEELRLLFCR